MMNAPCLRHLEGVSVRMEGDDAGIPRYWGRWSSAEVGLVLACRVKRERETLNALNDLRSPDLFSPPRYSFRPNTILTPYTMSITEIEQRCNVLRYDLKVWETKFTAQNQGRKAGRDDIKANEEICMHATPTSRAFELTKISPEVQRVQQVTK